MSGDFAQSYSDCLCSLVVVSCCFLEIVHCYSPGILFQGGLHMRTKSAPGVEMLHSVTVPSWHYVVFFIFREFYMLTTSATWWGQLWTSMSPCLNQWPSPVYSPCVASSSSSRYRVIFYALLLFYSTFYLTILKYIHVLCFIWSSFFCRLEWICKLLNL